MLQPLGKLAGPVLACSLAVRVAAAREERAIELAAVRVGKEHERVVAAARDRGRRARRRVADVEWYALERLLVRHPTIG